MTTELEKLCNPVFQCLCNYWQLSRVTGAADREKFLRDITGLLEQARKNASREPLLEREFAWMEKPLVFFIDYIVKEGRFPYSAEWRELARNYNELSGDEKFFDILNETLEKPDHGNSIVLFYVMLGLGFDGAYRNKRDHIEQCMRLCAEKAVFDYDIHSEPVISPHGGKFRVKRRPRFGIRAIIAVCALFMVACFIVNLTVFTDATDNYREILNRIVTGAARPQEPPRGERVGAGSARPDFVTEKPPQRFLLSTSDKLTSVGAGSARPDLAAKKIAVNHHSEATSDEGEEEYR
jgi:type IV/VI secretion system ImpK/VasF family protein